VEGAECAGGDEEETLIRDEVRTSRTFSTSSTFRTSAPPSTSQTSLTSQNLPNAVAPICYHRAMQLPPRVILAADHAGFPLKETLKAFLIEQGVDVMDIGTFSQDPVDYPQIVRQGCAAVLEEGVPGIVLGGSGNGEAMTANKVRGIRCALVYSDETAQLARAHNNANVMSLGGRLTKPEDAKRFTQIFLTTDFEGGRHEKRVDDLE